MRTRVALIGLLALALTGCASAAPSPSTEGAWPTSIAAIGHSGLTGYDSDSDKPGEDAKTNSWATGTNPDVGSIYERFLELDPAIEGHYMNAAVGGSDVDDLPAQVTAELQENPLPDLWIIQTVDNDVQCSDEDAANEVAYGTKITAVLQSIVDAVPHAKIYVVPTPVTWQLFTDVQAQRPEFVMQYSGTGVCDVFDAEGNQRPEAIAHGQEVTDAYSAQLRKACEQFPGCTDGEPEIRSLEIDIDDLAPDGAHFTISGLTKIAEVAWAHIRDLG